MSVLVCLPSPLIPHLNGGSSQILEMCPPYLQACIVVSEPSAGLWRFISFHLSPTIEHPSKCRSGNQVSIGTAWEVWFRILPVPVLMISHVRLKGRWRLLFPIVTILEIASRHMLWGVGDILDSQFEWFSKVCNGSPKSSGMYSYGSAWSDLRL